MQAKPAMEKQVIGRKDIISFPQFGLENVPVKIDTGAYSSTMHCDTIKLEEAEGKQVLKVVFLDPRSPGYTGETLEFETFKRKTVKSSNGIAEERFFITGNVKLFNVVVTTQFSLSTRSGLKNPVLLGRKLLNRRYVVDTSKVNCSLKFEQKHP